MPGPQPLSSAHELHDFQARPGAQRCCVPTRLFHDAPVHFHSHARGVDFEVVKEAEDRMSL